MRTADFDYGLPPELIAQQPAPARDQSRLMVFQRPSGRVEHRSFRDLAGYLQAGDVLVLNDSRVIPARLRGGNLRTGGRFELFLLEENGVNDWWVMLRPGRRVRAGSQIVLLNPAAQPDRVQATVLEKNGEGHGRVRFSGTANIVEELERLGEVPLPPYISRTGRQREAEDRERYQTVFAQSPGSVAAPTAGLHFTGGLLDELWARGVEVCFVTLHVGLGTFGPVKTESLAEHRMHEERYVLSEETAQAVRRARELGRRVVAGGTTSLRVLESAAVSADGHLVGGAGRTRLFIHPPHRFRTVDVLLTNFHLPRSTLLMLVCAFAAPGETRGRELLLQAYAEAIRERYRFFSYGDAMLIL